VEPSCRVLGDLFVRVENLPKFKTDFCRKQILLVLLLVPLIYTTTTEPASDFQG
jgi:hypothetical protein